MVRRPTRFAFCVAVIAAIALGGCSTVPQEQSAADLRGDSLTDAETFLVRAEHLRDNKDGATVYRLRAAEIAWAALAAHGA